MLADVLRVVYKYNCTTYLQLHGPSVSPSCCVELLPHIHAGTQGIALGPSRVYHQPKMLATENNLWMCSWL
jgi:hypothetical protein